MREAPGTGALVLALLLLASCGLEQTLLLPEPPFSPPHAGSCHMSGLGQTFSTYLLALTWYFAATLICKPSGTRLLHPHAVYSLLFLGTFCVACFHWDFRRQDLLVLSTLP